jgi:hypothetical protein
VVQALLGPRDLEVVQGLSCPGQYAQLVRCELGRHNRFYSQLVCEGAPYLKAQHTLGQVIVGLESLAEHHCRSRRAASPAPAVLPRGEPYLGAPAPTGPPSAGQ